MEEIGNLGGSAEFVRTDAAAAEQLAALHQNILDLHGFTCPQLNIYVNAWMNLSQTFQQTRYKRHAKIVGCG